MPGPSVLDGTGQGRTGQDKGCSHACPTSLKGKSDEPYELKLL